MNIMDYLQEKKSELQKEALGKTFIDIGVSIFKGVVLLFTLFLITLILKSLLDKDSKYFQ